LFLPDKAVMTKAVCFVLMPFGIKVDSTGRSINFDVIYDTIFKPAVNSTGLQPVRADEEQTQGFIHKLMYERLLLSEYAIADLTILNANVYYELGVRHVARPSTTIMTMAGQSGLPFDVAGLRALPYSLDPTGAPTDAKSSSAALVEQLKSCIAHTMVDSPIYQLVDGMQPPPIDPGRADIFRDRVASSEKTKGRIAAARAEQSVASIETVQQSLGDVAELEANVVIDLLTSYRDLEAYDKMIEIIKAIDPVLSETVAVRQLLAFAQNRIGQWREAEETFKKVIAARGPSSETNGMLGRVYKDRWAKAVAAEDTFGARGFLRQAIQTYLEGFEADWRDAYPGINAVTLMEAANDERRHALIPVVRYSVERRLARTANAEYWDYASRLELAVLADDADAAADALGDALSAPHGTWQLKTTANNLRAILNARTARKDNTTVVSTVLDELTKRIGDAK
jgi:tetratricopeptide (TPR) repeat protein